MQQIFQPRRVVKRQLLMIGMALGMLLAHITRGHPLAQITWLFVASLTTINNERSSLLLKHFMETGQVLSPQQISRMERVLPVWAGSWGSKERAKLFHRHIGLGVEVSSLKHPDMIELSGSASSHYKKAKYLLLEKKGAIQVIIHKQSAQADILQAYIHALVIASLIGRSKAVHTASRLWMNDHYSDFLVKFERLLSLSIVWRADWSHGVTDEKIG